MKRTINRKFLFGLVALVVVLGGGAFGLYKYQKHRHARDFLQKSVQAEEEGRTEEAVDSLNRYLVYRPEDMEAMERLGRLLDRPGASGRDRARAMAAFGRVLRQAPGREDLRRRLVAIALDLGRPGDARPHLITLLESTPNDAELEHLLGTCEEASKNYAKAAQWYARAARHAPRQLESSLRLTALFRERLNKPKEAAKVLDQMVAANRNSFRAYLERARFRKETGALDGWEKDVRAAVRLAPEEVEVVLAEGELLLKKNDLDGARLSLERGLKAQPKDARLYRFLADVELRAGRDREAVTCLRRGLAAFPDRKDLLEPLAETLLRQQKLDEAAETVDRLRQLNASPLTLDYLEARLLMHRGHFAEAARLLRKVRERLTGDPEAARQVDLYLARCCGELGSTDEQIKLLGRAGASATAGRGSSPSVRLELALALLKAGRLDESLDECKAILAQPQAPAEATILLVRVQLAKNLQRPPAERRWEEVQRLLEQVSHGPAGATAEALRAQVLACQEKFDEAQALLEKALARWPDEVGLWLTLTGLVSRRQETTEAEAVLQRAQQRLGDRVELRLARAALWVRTKGSKTARRLGTLTEGIEKFSPEDQGRLLHGLGEAWSRIGEEKEARAVWDRLARLRPHDLRPHLLLFENALRAGNEAGMREQEEQVHKLEGEEGTFWRYAEAVRLLHRASKGDRNGLGQARQRQQEIARLRPAWPRLALLEARLHEAEGRLREAATAYARAVSLGDRRPEVLRRLAGLLFEQQRYDEVDELLRGMPSEDLVAGGLGRLASMVSLHARDPERALALARSAVPADSTDYRDHLWLAQVLASAGKDEEAEVALRRASRLDGRAPASWVALVQYLARAGRREQAEAALREAESKLPEREAPLALARCYQALGQVKKAEAQYQAALKTSPRSPAILRAAAGFHLGRNEGARAEPLLRRLLEPETKADAVDLAWARRSLAIELAGRGAFLSYREALALLDKNGPQQGAAGEDQRARALVLAALPGRRQEAVRLLESLRTRRLLAPADQFFLAGLYQAGKDWRNAQEVLSALVAAEPGNPIWRAALVRVLLVRNDSGAAGHHLRQVEEQEPGAFQTVELRARLLRATGKDREARELLQKYAEEKDAPLLAVAALLEELGEGAAAEPLYRKYAAVPDQPEKALFLAAYLGRRGRFAEALDLLEQAWKTCPPQAVAFTAVAMLHAPGARAEHFERVARDLETALAKNPDLVPVLLHLATLRDLQGRHAEAEQVYRRLLNRAPDNVVALNNLAWLLAHQKGKGNEALSLLRRAIDTAGPLPELRDTRAVVSLSLGESKAAVEDLEAVVREAPTATRYFHLARAELLAGHRGSALDALGKAKAAGLKAEALHPLERASYQPLLKELGRP